MTGLVEQLRELGEHLDYADSAKLVHNAADALSRATDEEGLARVLHEAECRITGYDVPWSAEVESEREQARTIARAIINHIKGEKKDG